MQTLSLVILLSALQLRNSAFCGLRFLQHYETEAGTVRGYRRVRRGGHFFRRHASRGMGTHVPPKRNVIPEQAMFPES
jgi:hypothetical protein